MLGTLWSTLGYHRVTLGPPWSLVSHNWDVDNRTSVLTSMLSFEIILSSFFGKIYVGIFFIVLISHSSQNFQCNLDYNIYYGNIMSVAHAWCPTRTQLRPRPAAASSAPPVNNAPPKLKCHPEVIFWPTPWCFRIDDIILEQIIKHKQLFLDSLG